MKRLLPLVLLPSVAFAALDVSLADAKGRPLAVPGVEMSLSRSVDALGIETVVCRIRGTLPGTNLVMVVAQDAVPGATAAWDGHDEVPASKAPFECPLLFDNRFLFGAAHDGRHGVALGVGAEDGVSFADFRCMQRNRSHNE